MDWTVLKTWGPWLVVSAAVGVFVATRVPSAALQAVFGVLAGLAGLWMAFGRDSARLGQAMPAGSSGQPADCGGLSLSREERQ